MPLTAPQQPALVHPHSQITITLFADLLSRPELARWYGVDDHGLPELDDSKITKIDMGDDVPTPLGYGPGAKMSYHWTIADWAKKPENKKAWQEIMVSQSAPSQPRRHQFSRA